MRLTYDLASLAANEGVVPAWHEGVPYLRWDFPWVDFYTLYLTSGGLSLRPLSYETLCLGWILIYFLFQLYEHYRVFVGYFVNVYLFNFYYIW